MRRDRLDRPEAARDDWPIDGGNQCRYKPLGLKTEAKASA